MFAAGDFAIQRLLTSHSSIPSSPLPTCSSNSSATSSTSFDDTVSAINAMNTNMNPLNAYILATALLEQQDPAKVLQDYVQKMQNLQNLQILQIQMLLQQPSLFQNLIGGFGQVEKVKEVEEKISPSSTPESQPKIALKLQNPSPHPAEKPQKISPTVSRKRHAMNMTKNHGPTDKHDHRVPTKRSKTHKRLLTEDHETDSPVSGMHIKKASEIDPDDLLRAQELDETASYVCISDEIRQAIAKIPNVIGESRCSLCKIKFDDVFKLAKHKCPMISHDVYRCPDCDKVFSCPANLASHRRWHKPKDALNDASTTCNTCFEAFPTKKALRAHKCPVLAASGGSSLNLTILGSVNDSSSTSCNTKSFFDDGEEENEDIEVVLG